MMDSTIPPNEECQENDEGSLIPTDNGKSCCPRDVIASLIACVGAIIMGVVIGYSSPALNNEDFKKLLQTDDNGMWFGSLLGVGALLGSPLGGILRTKLGLKLTLILSNVPLGLGWLMIIIGRHIALFFIGRLMTGIGVGIISFAVPLYVAEIAEKSRRGILGCCFQLSVTIGILVCYSIGMVIRWNYLALMCLAISLVYTGMLLFVPESPRWFISKKKPSKAFESLKWIHSNDQRAEIELAFLESFVLKQEAEQGDGLSCSDLSQSEIYKPILIGIGLMIFQQMSGINAVLFYLASTFSRAGFSGNVAMPTIIVGFILVISTAIACSLIDRLGRRVLLLFSGISMTISLIAFGVYYYLMDVSKVEVNINWLSLTSVCAFTCSFSLGWSCIPWLVTAEIIPPKAKSFGLSLTTITNWLFVFLTTKLVDGATMTLTNHGTMWMFGACCLLGCLFVIMCIPETKGHSLEEIQKHFSKREEQTSDS